jgi:hypothetical protein
MVNVTLLSFKRPRESMRYSLDKRLGGPQSRSGQYYEDKYLGRAGNSSPAIQAVAKHFNERLYRVMS